MRTTKVLLIESARNNGVSFAASLQRKYEVQIARSGKQGLALARESLPDVIVLNAASMRTSGDRISARLRAQVGELPIIHIRPEAVTDDKVVADVLLTPPFTSRKLINRVERFVPALEAETIEVGPFSLNVEQHTLTTPWSEKKLTPKLVELLKLFLRHPATTLERKHIMQTIWKTDYMGDTRTLDVHIRWLRQVVEPTPRKPRYILTVRGVGYRFALPDEKASAGDTGKQSSKKEPSVETQTRTEASGQQGRSEPPKSPAAPSHNGNVPNSAGKRGEQATAAGKVGVAEAQRGGAPSETVDTTNVRPPERANGDAPTEETASEKED